MFGAQQSLQHGVSRHTDLLQPRSLELSSQIHDLDVEVFDLQGNCRDKEQLSVCYQKHIVNI